jgi:hypothetical protein
VNAIDLLPHLFSFAAPALAVALVVAAAGRWLLPKGASRPGWWLLFAINFIAGLVVLGVGLWFFGRDGKMLTYAALVVVVAMTQWLSGRAWRG